MGDFFGNLYEKFLMRDLLSFITPGAIVVTSVLLLWQSPSELRDNLVKIYWILYIPIFGFLFMVGFAVQCFWAKVLPCWLGLPPLIKLHLWLSGKDSCNDATLRHLYKTQLMPFRQIADKYKDIDQSHERLVVLKQMSGNGFFAILMASPFLVISQWSPESSLWRLIPTIVLAIVLWLSLYCNHRHSLREESILEEVILKGNPKEKS